MHRLLPSCVRAATKRLTQLCTPLARLAGPSQKPIPSHGNKVGGDHALSRRGPPRVADSTSFAPHPFGSFSTRGDRFIVCRWPRDHQRGFGQAHACELNTRRLRRRPSHQRPQGGRGESLGFRSGRPVRSDFCVHRIGEHWSFMSLISQGTLLFICRCAVGHRGLKFTCR
jgi:hypothetical protein